MKALNAILKLGRVVLVVFVLFNLGVIAYAVIWMRPHAEHAMQKFEKTVAVGMDIQDVRALAVEVGADDFFAYELSPPEKDATRVAVISFYRFPGGLARNTCRIKFNKDIATLITYGYSG